MRFQHNVVQYGEYIIKNHATIRDAAKKFGISKSSMHKHLTKTLSEIDFPLYEKVKLVLAENFAEKHIRGGNATKNRYKKYREA